MKEFYTFDEIGEMPIKKVFEEVKYFTPKLAEIAERQKNSTLEAELTGNKQGRKPR